MPSISPIISKDYFCRCDDTNIEKKGEKESSYGFIGLQFHHIWRDVYGTGALVKQSLDRKDLTKIERDWNHMVTECSKQRSPSQPADVNVNFLLGCMEERIITLLNRLNKHHPPLPAVYLVPRPAPIVGKSASEIMKTHASSSYLRSYPQPQPLVRTAMCNDNTPLGTTLSHPSLYEFNRAGTSAGRGSAAAGSNSLRKNNEESHQDIQISTVAEIVRPNDENRLFSLYPPLFGHIQAVEERQSPRGLQTTIIPTVQFRALQQDEDVFHYCATVVRKPISDDTFSSSSDSGGGEGSKLNTSTSSKGPKIASIQTLKLFSFLSGVPLVCYEDADIVCDTIDGNGIFEGNLINYVKSVLGNARNEVRLAATILKERELSDVGKTIPSAGSEQDLLKLLQEAFVLGGVIKDEGRNNNSDISSTPAIPPVVLWTPAFVDGLLKGIRRRIDRLNKEIDEHERDNANGQGAQSVPSLADRPPPLLGVSQATANWLYTGGSKSRLQPNDGTLARAWVSSNLSMTDFENGGNMLNSLWGLPSLVRKPFEKTIEDVLQLMPDGQPRSLRAQLPIDVIPSGLMNNTNLRKGADVTITDDNVLEVPFSKFTKREIGNDVPFARSRLSPLIPSKDVHVSSWAPLEAIVKLVPDSNNEGTHTDDITAKKKRDIMIHNKKGLVASLGQSMEFVRSHISPMVRFYQRHGKELQSDMEASGISSTQFPEVLDRRVDVEFLSEHSVPLFEAVKTYGEYFLQKNHSRNQDKGTLAERNGVHFPMLKMPTIVSSDVSSTKQNSLSTIRPLFNHYDNDVSLMDIGGNVGLFSYLIRSEMNVNAYMFEALLANVYLLETTGCLNRVREGSAWASAVEAIVTTTSIKAKVIFSDSGSSNAASVTNHEKAALFSSTTLTAVVTFPSSSSSVLLRRLRSIALCNEAPSSNASHWVYHCTPNLRSASIFYGALGKEKPNPGKKGTLCVIMANEGNVGDTFVTCNPEDVAKAHILIARLKELDLTVSNPSAFKHFSSSEFIWGSLLPFGFLTVNRLDSIVMNDTMWALDAPSPSDPTARNFPRIFDDGNVHDAGVLSHENNTNNVTTNKESNVSSTSSGREGNTSTSVIGRLGLHPILLKRALKVIFDFDVTDEEYQYISIPLSQSQVPATSRRISAALSHLHPQFVKRFEKLIKQEYAKMLPHKVKRDEEGQERGKRETEGDGVLFPQFKAYPSAVSVIYVNRLQSTRDLLRYVCIRQYSFKMDVENFEPFIIQGASNFLKEPLFRPISFVSEIRMSSETVAMAKKMVQRPSSSKTKGKRGNATSNENHESEEAYDYVGFYLDQPVLLRNERDVEEKVSTDGLRGVSNMLWVRRGLEYLIFPMLPPIYHWN